MIVTVRDVQKIIIVSGIEMIAPPLLLYLFFFFYASAVEHWNRLPTINKIPIGLVIVVFGVLDILINLTWGSWYYLDMNVLHGAPFWSVRAWTFSDRSCYWFHKSGWRRKRARFIANQLNLIYPGHIS